MTKLYEYEVLSKTRETKVHADCTNIGVTPDGSLMVADAEGDICKIYSHYAWDTVTLLCKRNCE